MTIPLTVALPLAAAALLLVGGDRLPRALAFLIATGAAAAVAALSALLVVQSSAATLVYWFGGWTPRHGVALGIAFAVDPFGAGLAALAGALVLAALVFSSRYFDPVGVRYQALMMTFLAAMAGFALTGDLFDLFVFFELMSAAAFALCGYKTEEPAPLEGALNFAVTNTIGAVLVLTGIGLVYGATGALNMAQIGATLPHARPALVAVALAFIASGFLVKAAAIPFHFWLADAHAVAPTPVCILFSGVMVQLGLYATARVYWTLFDGALSHRHAGLRAMFVALGVLTALGGALMCWAQRHVKRLLAFSTVSHMGVLIVAFGLLSPTALAGAGVYVLGHAAVKAALFLCAGILLHRLSSIDEVELCGRGRRLTAVAVIFVLAGAGLSGLPPFGTLTGERLLDDAAAALGWPWLWLVGWLAGAVTGGAVFRVAGRVFVGWGPRPSEEPRGEKIDEGRETVASGTTPAVMWMPAAALALLGLVVGVIPGLPDAAAHAAARFTSRSAYAATVLGTAAPPVSLDAAPAGSAAGAARAMLATLAGLALAAHALFRHRLPAALRLSPPRLLDRAFETIEELHSGNVCDYVAFIVAGAATLGGACLILLGAS